MYRYILAILLVVIWFGFEGIYYISYIFEGGIRPIFYRILNYVFYTAILWLFWIAQ